jgi:hypothetical protein
MKAYNFRDFLHQKCGRTRKGEPPQHDLRFRFEGIIPKAKGGERMLTVEDYELIRRKLLVDKQSIRAIAKELGHSRKTVAKPDRPVP